MLESVPIEGQLKLLVLVEEAQSLGRMGPLASGASRPAIEGEGQGVGKKGGREPACCSVAVP